MTDLIHKDDSYYAATRSDMLRFIDGNPRRILEIGCGAGNFSRNFSDVEYWGIEPNKQMAIQAENIATKILLGTYDDVESLIPDFYFDLVVCNDVIEHMSDPAGFLERVKHKLSPLGKLIVSLPNLRFAPLLYNLVFHGEFEYIRSGILDYTHLHLFTQKSFTTMASSCGWNVEVIEAIQIQDFKPLKKIILKLLERGHYGELRAVQFAARLSLCVNRESDAAQQR